MRISFGDGFVFDSERRVLERGATPVRLSPKAFAVLELLIAERPRALSKRELLDRVWSDVYVEEQNVKNAIVELRAGLGDGRDCIRTVQRYGYAFAAEDEAPASARLLTADAEYALVNGDNTIGRARGCSVVLTESGVSRHHARIHVSGARAVLEDLGSKNGTFVNEKRIERPVDLADGDAIRIGMARPTFRSAPRGRRTTTIR